MAEPKKTPDKEKPQAEGFFGALATDEDLEQLTEIRNNINGIAFFIANAPQEKIPELQNQIRQLQAESTRIYCVILKRFILSYSENQGAIMEHFSIALNNELNSKETYEKGLVRRDKLVSGIIDASKEDVFDPEADADKLKEAEAAGLFGANKETPNFSNYYIYLFSDLFDFLPALVYYDLDTSGFFDAIRDKAAAAYPNDDHSVIVHHPGEESQQTFTEQEYRAYREKLYRNSRTAILKRPADAESTGIPELDLQLFADGTGSADASGSDQEFIPRQLSLFDEFSLAVPSNPVTRAMGALSLRGLVSDPLRNGAAIYQVDATHTVTIENFDKIKSNFGVSGRKILDVSRAALVDQNPYRPKDGRRINNVVCINLEEYARANGYQVDPADGTKKERQRIKDNKKTLKETIERDLTTIESMRHTWRVESGKNKGDYATSRIISSHSIIRGVIRIVFDTDMAERLLNASLTQYPTVLLKLDNRNPNSYSIGAKIAEHSSMDNNVLGGTANTLTVATLLKAAPEIVDYETLTAKKEDGGRGRRDWKPQIKEKLEASLDDLVKIGFLTRWEYRGRGDKRLTKKGASRLTWEEYAALRVDFAIKDDPNQTQRLIAKAERAAEAAKEAGAVKKKRGRPKKDQS